MLKTVMLVLLVAVVTLFAAISTVLIQPHLLRPLLSDGVQRVAGLELEIAELSSHRNPLRLELRGVQLRNPDWPDGELLSLDTLSLQLTELPFSAQPFWGLYGNGLTITVARNGAGELNWISDELAAGEAEPVAEPSPVAVVLPEDFNFNEIRLHNVSLIWRTPNAEERLSLPVLAAQRVEAGNGKLHLDLEYRQQQFTLDSRVDLFDPAHGILQYQLDLGHERAELQTRGRLALSPDLSGSEIDLALTFQDLQWLAAITGTTMPDLPATSLSTTLAITPDYQLREIHLNSGNSELRGEVMVDQKTLAVVADLSASTVDFDELFPPAETPAEEPEREEAPIDWAWLDPLNVHLEAKIDQLRARGWSATELTLQGQLGGKIMASATAAQLSEAATSRQLDDLAVEANLAPLAKRTQGADLNTTLKLALGDIQLQAEGDLNVNGLQGTHITLDGKAPESAAVWRAAQLPWQEAGPLTLEATLVSEKARHSGRGTLRMGEQNLEFDLVYSPPAAASQARPKLEGELALRKLDLAFVSDGKEKPAAKPSKGPLFSAQPLPLAPLRDLDAALNIELSDIDTGFNLLRKASLKPVLENGKLTLNNARLTFADAGEALISASLDSSAELPVVQLRLKLNSENFGQLGLEKAAGIRGGEGQVQLRANSQGGSVASLAANLDARLDAKVTDLQAKGNALNLIGSDLLTELISTLNPFTEKTETTEIECLAVHFSGKNGKLHTENGIALETDSTKIIGTGRVDLEEESLSFGVSPIARKGVGLNIGAAAGLVRLAGSFQNPRIVADPSGMFTSGLSTGAAIYTGGLSLLAQGLYKRALYAGSACDGDLKDIPAAEQLPQELLAPPAPLPEAEPLPSGMIQASGGPSSGLAQDDDIEAVAAQQ